MLVQDSMLLYSFSFLSSPSWASSSPPFQEWLTRCGALTSLPLLRRLLPSLPSLLLQTPSIFTSCRGTLERATAQKSNKIYAPEKRIENGFFCDMKDNSSLLG
jgi:hypothetical protein